MKPERHFFPGDLVFWEIEKDPRSHRKMQIPAQVTHTTAQRVGVQITSADGLRSVHKYVKASNLTKRPMGHLHAQV